MPSGSPADQWLLEVGWLACYTSGTAEDHVTGALATTAIRPGEAALVERARQGDHEAFGVLVDGRLGATFRTALAILGNEADARDATQEIYLRAWRNLPELREADRF